MEWVETTGKTVAEALDVALDQLGVDESDAEYEIVGEPKMGLFGRLKTEARIRARVRPTAPPSKDVANNNRRRRPTRGDRPTKSGSSERPQRRSSSDADASTDEAAEASTQSSPKSARPKPRRKPASNKPQGATEMAEEDVPLDRQGEIAGAFLTGLMREAGTPVNVDISVDEEDEIILVAVAGDNLGHLIGPKGATLQSLQELTRTVVQRQTGARNGRVIVDVGGYREKRREALERFSRQVADEVLASGGQRILEPMNPADRKVVHDLIGTIDGVSTSSEGEEPRRYVVITSDSAANEVG